MSSIESTVLEIDEEYNNLLELFNTLVVFNTAYYYGGIQPPLEKDLLNLIRKTMSFQRKIENSNISIQKQNYKKVINMVRLDAIAARIVSRFTDEKACFDRINLQNRESLGVAGVLPELNEAHQHILKESRKSAYAESGVSLYKAYHGFRLLYPIIIEFEEEMRLISALTIYPIEKKSLLKNQLVVNSFEQVAVSLEEAESNVEIEHFKDCVGRCRDALEVFTALLREKATGERTEMAFSIDLGKLVKVGVFDEATQRITQGIYSFLSIKGSHKYDASKVTVYDAETSLKETYSIIEMLLKKISEYNKRIAEKS
jgi:hypothetical protein